MTVRSLFKSSCAAVALAIELTNTLVLLGSSALVALALNAVRGGAHTTAAHG
jgi:heme/copper-type cytochrome/quinol oxidase subunit 3